MLRVRFRVSTSEDRSIRKGIPVWLSFNVNTQPLALNAIAQIGVSSPNPVDPLFLNLESFFDLCFWGFSFFREGGLSASKLPNSDKRSRLEGWMAHDQCRNSISVLSCG